MIWEYKITHGPFHEEFLNEHGKAGWELVAIVRGVSDKDCVWKRPADETAPERLSIFSRLNLLTEHFQLTSCPY